jgi:site-specific recombinase XerD
MRQVFDQLRADGLTPRTLARKMSTLRQFYRWARRKGLISEIPLRNIPIPKTGHTLPKPVSNADFKTLVNSAVMDAIEKKTSLDKNQISKVLSKNAPHPEQTAARRQANPGARRRSWSLSHASEAGVSRSFRPHVGL